MNVESVAEDKDFLTIRIPLEGRETFLESEEALQAALNQAGILATAALLRRHDTNGTPIVHNGIKMTSAGLFNKVYQSPYGPVKIKRHLYQTSKGGKTFCPLERGARIVHSATPKFAKMLASKYSQKDARSAIRDLAENHGRPLSLCLAQDIVDTVGTLAQAADEAWTYLPPKLSAPVKTIAIGLDGTCMYIVGDGWRQAMVGTIALYDRGGERLHTTYIGAGPEMGRETFLRRLEQAIQQAKQQHPRALKVGLADGAASNWEFLEKHTDMQVLDFYHASEHLGKAAEAIFPDSPESREQWMETWCHRLKHEPTGPRSVIKEMSRRRNAMKGVADGRKKVVEGTIQYFRNNLHRMAYSLHVDCHRPIGSGVTEAACKVIIKQRLGCSGMRWKTKGAGVVISLRCLHETDGRWNQFWTKAMEVGFPDGWSSTC